MWYNPAFAEQVPSFSEELLVLRSRHDHSLHGSQGGDGDGQVCRADASLRLWRLHAGLLRWRVFWTSRYSVHPAAALLLEPVDGRLFVKESLLALFPDLHEAIEQKDDPGEYGVEDFWCRFACCLIFMLTMTNEAHNILRLFTLFHFIPSTAQSWISKHVNSLARKLIEDNENMKMPDLLWTTGLGGLVTALRITKTMNLRSKRRITLNLDGLINHLF